MGYQISLFIALSHAKQRTYLSKNDRRLTYPIEQLPTGRVLQEDVLDVALGALAEELQDVRMLQDLLDADLLLDGAFRVRMLFQIDHLHRDGLTRLAVDEQLHSVCAICDDDGRRGQIHPHRREGRPS